MIDNARTVVPAIGLVVIGRDEGERLRRCVISLRGASDYLVGVDSDFGLFERNEELKYTRIESFSQNPNKFDSTIAF